MAHDKTLEAVIDAIDVNAAVPVEEPMRQYYYIKKCRQFVEEK